LGQWFRYDEGIYQCALLSEDNKSGYAGFTRWVDGKPESVLVFFKDMPILLLERRPPDRNTQLWVDKDNVLWRGPVDVTGSNFHWAKMSGFDQTGHITWSLQGHPNSCALVRLATFRPRQGDPDPDVVLEVLEEMQNGCVQGVLQPRGWAERIEASRRS